MLADYHMHTCFSDDSTYEMEDEVKKLGYTQFCTFEKMKPVFHDL